MNWKAIIDDFLQVAHLAGVILSLDTIIIETLPPGSRPHSLPSGKMAVYVFIWNDQCLKVGKAGPKSNARYMSQHYNPWSSQSNLAKSTLNYQGSLGLTYLTEATVGDWIRDNTIRTNILLDESAGIPALGLLESFLQCRLKPRFEGFESQK